MECRRLKQKKTMDLIKKFGRCGGGFELVACELSQSGKFAR